ncbi:phage baseplate assembly protein V, partial [Campylobacter jejuni]|nr:phage baseplate assembly protein V [Campylobacter jejuni]
SSTLKLDLVKDKKITSVDKSTHIQINTLITIYHTTNANNITLNAPSINLNVNTKISGAISTRAEGGASGTFSIKVNIKLIC